ncbi:hypothetical protein CA600_30055 [Paenibacillus sp. VTT E-133280]|jgi:uncharacterized membrane protein|uniref:DUF1700 domain-containing protein n=1 Tax=unclassified Paenibacillus TaxID=185978 RepID=UPI000B9FE503|nr:DUF1700 domain-containing protein [Paenibacillus sp. VTT E-133280]OZQ58912.1 hypothetical protein CA600_30055 [Paenibacillus sp. VTT E-133280]
MNKAIFLSELADKLEALPRIEVNKSLAFYSEIIDDRMEEGMGEEEAVCGLGNIEEIAREVMLDSTPLKKIILPSDPISKLDYTLLILSIPLLLLLFALIFVFYVTIWLVVIALFLVEFSFLLAGIAGIVAAIIDFSNNISFNSLMIVGGLISLGLGIFTFAPFKKVCKKIMGLTTWFMRKIKSIFLERGHINVEKNL